MKLVIRTENVTVRLGNEDIISDLNLDLEGPGLVVVIGPNGAGKTTLFQTLVGLVKPHKGKVRINNVDVTGNPKLAGKHIGYMPQLSQVNRSFPITGREFVESSILFRMKPPRLRVPGWVSRKTEEIVRELGALEFMDKPISELSGGQIQRLMIARTVVPDTPILLLDEPTSAIDPRGKLDVIKFIEKLSRNKLVLLTTHDPTVFKEKAKLLIVFWRGVKAIGKPVEVLKPEILREIYGEMVIPVKECVHLVDTHAV
ncbi:MAG: metal ABC transporter ATP-binding protein [Desulfurococcales archaeon]|nr:metal ABC transporter ATP-binding protein [Desulfurococcales archaeon]